MASLSRSIRKFHLYSQPRVVSIKDVADGLQLRRPASIRNMARQLDALPTELRLGEAIVTGTALGGRAEIVLRSDGSYTSSGHMRATGLPSFAFHVSVTVESASDRFLPTVVHQGRVFGTDTPGDRQRNWTENGRNEDLRQNWLSLARDARLSVRKEYNVAGTLGTLRDVAVRIAQFVGLAAATHPGLAAVVVLGATLGEATKQPLPSANLPAGVMVTAGVLLVFGPSAIVPALVAGGAAEALVKHRPLSEKEALFAAKVFGPTLPPRQKIILTNLAGLSNRAFVIPGLGDSYLVNLGPDSFNDPMSPRGKYSERGQLLIHELTHVWQAKRWPAMTYFCKGAFEGSYEPGSAPSKPWSGYGIEQQATIVDRWYAADPTFLNGEFIRPNPDFSKKQPHPFDHYIRGNIRAGLT